MQIQKEFYFYWIRYLYYLLNKRKILHLFGPTFVKIHRKFMYNTYSSDSFPGQGDYIKWHF